MLLFRLFFAVILLAFFSCSKNKKLEVRKVGEITFRRTYVDLMGLRESEKDTLKANRFADSIISEDPYLITFFTDSQKLINNKLIQVGLVNNDQLLLSKFDSFAKDTIKLFGKNNENILITQEFDDSLGMILRVTRTEQVEKIILNSGRPVKLTQINLFNGKYNELVVLNNWYIMNGDNYDIVVYKVE